MFKKYRNPFDKFRDMFSMFGGIVDMEGEGDAGGAGGDAGGNLDPIGGRIGDDGHGSDNMGGDADGNADPGKSADSNADPGKADDKGAADPGKADDKGTPDYESRFANIDNNFQKLFDAIKSTNSGDDGKGGKSGDADNLSGLEHEDLVALMADNPGDFIAKLTGVIEKSVSDRVAAENANTQRSKEIEKTIDVYADANPDFEQMWDKGELQSYMEKNPGHNAISAHMALTMETRIAEAKKQGAEEAIKNFRTKSNSQLLNGGNGIPLEQRDAALKNPNKFGGRAAVIAARAGITS